MKICIIPGSFDPPTNGHIDLIERASALFDKVIILIAKNTLKKNLFTDLERKEMFEEIFKNNSKIRVDICDGLVASYAVKAGADALVRGLRNATDYTYETEIYQLNKTLCPELETIFIPARSSLSSISSSMIKELALYNMDVSLFVPTVVNNGILKKKLNKNKSE